MKNTSDFERWYKYDIEYIENWSLFLDFKIILKTPFSLFSSGQKEFSGSGGIEPTTLSLKAPALPIELPTLKYNDNLKTK